jgi:hypothetical protein
VRWNSLLLSPDQHAPAMEQVVRGPGNRPWQMERETLTEHPSEGSWQSSYSASLPRHSFRSVHARRSTGSLSLCPTERKLRAVPARKPRITGASSGRARDLGRCGDTCATYALVAARLKSVRIVACTPTRVDKTGDSSPDLVTAGEEVSDFGVAISCYDRKRAYRYSRN